MIAAPSVAPCLMELLHLAIVFARILDDADGIVAAADHRGSVL
jgi:hypothetical protein